MYSKPQKTLHVSLIKIESGSLLHYQSVSRFETPGKTPLIEFLIIFQPFGCMDEPIVFGLLYRKRIIIRIMNFPVDHNQFLIHFPWDLNFLNHICCMRDIPHADTYRLLTIFGQGKGCPGKIISPEK